MRRRFAALVAVIASVTFLYVGASVAHHFHLFEDPNEPHCGGG